MTFQASDLKGRQFLNLLDEDFNIIEPYYQTQVKAYVQSPCMEHATT